MIHSTKYAEGDLYLEVYVEFLRRARDILSDHRDKIHERKLLEIKTEISGKIRGLIRYL